MLLLIFAALMFGWLWGYERGLKDSDQFTEYWYQDSKKWMQIALDLMNKPDDDGGIQRRIPEPIQEPVKVMAKAAGASRQ